MNFDPKRLKAIVFDVDGTLYRQSPLRRAMFFRLVREAVSRPISALSTFRALRAYRRAQEDLRGTRGDGALAAEQLRLASERSGQTAHAVAEIVARWMEQEPLKLLEGFIKPALRPLLQEARRRGLRLGVFSDYPATAKLEAMRLTEFFEAVVTAQDSTVNRFKPDPAGIIETLRLLETSPGEALYVGDRAEIDGAAALAAGVRCIIVGERRGNPPAAKDWVPVAGYGELHNLLFSSESGPIQ
jgi:HAD superfamily hydrolase (TIGR01549 family)